MGIFDAIKKPGDELSEDELNRKAGEFDRVVGYYKDRGDKRNEEESKTRWGRK